MWLGFSVVGHKTNNGYTFTTKTLTGMNQKLNYIHNNPINYPWNLVQYPEEYKYSSAKFYETGIDEFGLLTHYRD